MKYFIAAIVIWVLCIELEIWLLDYGIQVPLLQYVGIASIAAAGGLRAHQQKQARQQQRP